MRLFTLAVICGEKAGFLLPIFHAHERGNQHFVQNIDEDNKIISFEPMVVDDYEKTRVLHDIEADVGQQALWAFRDHLGKIHTGTFQEIQKTGLKLLGSKSLLGFPMAAAEIAAFCRVESQFPAVMKAAMTALSVHSPLGAEVWRDTVVLLPLIKQDIADRMKKPLMALQDVHDVLAITRRNVTHIYAPPSISSVITNLPRWQELAGFFGIKKFEVHTLRRKSDSTTIVNPTWSVLGIGGIAHHVITRSPFFGFANHIQTPNGGVSAHGAIDHPIVGVSDHTRLIVSIMGSNIADARKLDLAADTEYARNAMKHAINIRPIGFGSPKSHKASPLALRQELTNYDYVWIIANHRQRKTSRHAPSLSASNTASRIVRATALGLIACLGSRKGISILSDTRRERGFGLVGATRYSTFLSKQELARRVLCGMLCEEANLHTAERIVLLWPPNIDDDENHLNVKIGRHQYEVEFITRPLNPGRYDVVGFAINVRESLRTEQDFFDFCESLVSGYGWHYRGSDGASILLENEGEGMWLWPVTSLGVASELCNTPADRTGQLIVTNWSIPHTMRATAKTNGWNIVHYSDLGHWMYAEFGMTLFSED